MSVIKNVLLPIEKHKMLLDSDTILVAVSGGADSLCLLHLLRSLSGQFGVRLHVAHLEHGIRGEASVADAMYVADLAAKWRLPCTVTGHDVPAYAAEHRITIEEAAREVRYAFLAEVAQAIGATKVAVAHQANDQAETILMNLLRGTGLRGLRGMQPVSRWPFRLVSGQDLLLLRPLLYVSRAEIEGYCKRHDLTPRLDHTNLDTTYRRNRIRYELMPVLTTYNPAIIDVLQRLGTLITVDYDYLQQQLLDTWASIATQRDDTIVFALASWHNLHPSLQRGLLREAIRRLVGTLQAIEATHIEIALDLIGEKPTGSSAHLPHGLRLHKSYDQFALGRTIPRPNVPQLTLVSLSLAVTGTTKLPDSNWCVTTKILPSSAIDLDTLRKSSPWVAHLDDGQVRDELHLRSRQPGDRFQPLGMGGQSKLVSDFMTDSKIPAAVRDKLPLAVSAEQIVWIPGYRLDERVKITASTRRILRIAFQRVEEADAQQASYPANE